MGRDGFWKIIDRSRREVDDAEEVVAIVAEHLSELSPDEIVSFEQCLQELLNESYRWDLWAVAYVVNGGCSDDGFEYFRGWLVTNGRKRWEAAMKDPTAIAKWVQPDEVHCECEDMLYVAHDAYKAVTGAELPPLQKTDRPSDPLGERWEEADLEKLYPALWRKFN